MMPGKAQRVMQTRSRRFVLVTACALLFRLSVSPAAADTNAVMTMGLASVGYVFGAVGFSFTPTTNIAVTRVGCPHQDANNPVIHFWSDTNYIIASFPLKPSGITNGTMLWADVQLTLLASNRYTVALQVTPNPAFPMVYEGSSQFQLAPQLTNYLSRIFLPGSVVSQGTNFFLLGANFSFTNQTAPIQPPRLSVTRSGPDGAVVSWPATPRGFVLQHKPSLSESNWTLTTNVVELPNGTNQVLISPATADRFFRLIHP